MSGLKRMGGRDDWDATHQRTHLPAFEHVVVGVGGGATTVKLMSRTNHVNSVLPELGQEHTITVSDLLFSDSDDRRNWVDAVGGDDQLAKRLEALYELCVEVQKHGGDRKPIKILADVIEKLARERRPYPAKHWVVWPLDAQGRHQFEITPSGRRVYQRPEPTYRVPSVAQLPAVERGGSYILIFTGGTYILGVDRVREALAELVESVNVRDVILREYEGKSTTFWSCHLGLGYRKQSGGDYEEVPWPEDIPLDWWKENRHAQ